MKITVILICLLASVSSLYTQISELWRKSYTQEITSAIRSYSTDNDGNFIIGSAVSRSAPNFSDFLVIKFNPEGDTLWRREYQSRDGFQDHLWDVHADNSGSVYVTGVSTDYNSETTLRTLKYSSTGALLWQRADSIETKQQNNGFTIEAYLAEGPDGNIYICTNDLGFLHMIRYTPAGAKVWSKVTSIPQGIAYMFVRGFEVNSLGMIISTEFVDNVNYHYNVLGLKCNYNGDTLWTWKDTFGNNFWEGAGALTIDAAGNSYFLSQVMLDFTTSKFALTILSPAGGVIKTSIYGSGIINDRYIPHDITLDNTGSVLTAVERSYKDANNITRYEGLVVKYSPSGDSVWSKRMRENSNVIPFNIQVTGDNSIYISGQYPMSGSSCQFIQKMSPQGDSLWNFNTQGVNYWQIGKYSKIDNSGNVYLVSERQNGIMITKFGIPIGIQYNGNEVPGGFSLSQNYPNPFNPVTNIEFSIPQSSNVQLVIYDIQGKAVETIVNHELKAGKYTADWNASKYSSGVYFYKLTADGFTDTKRMVLVK